MRSFLFIGDPKDKVQEWLDGEHKVLVIAPASEHDSTNRALVTLKTVGLEHEIVKTIILDEEYMFGEGKIDEYLQNTTKQTHYPYIYINKEFVGDHRTIAYMDYQGTLINTVGLVFLVPQSDSLSRQPSSDKADEIKEEEEDEEEVKDGNNNDVKKNSPEDKTKAVKKESVKKSSVKGSDKGSDKGSAKGSDKGSDNDSVQGSKEKEKGSNSIISSAKEAALSVIGSDRTNTPYKSIAPSIPTPDTIGEPGCCSCWCTCSPSPPPTPSPKPGIKPILCSTCNKRVQTAEKGTDTAEKSAQTDSPPVSEGPANSADMDYIS